jgi:ABC-type branched-subunit amino acid transport system ATPase component
MKESIFRVKDSGKTIILIELSMKMVMNTTDTITVSQNGTKIAEGNLRKYRIIHR